MLATALYDGTDWPTHGQAQVYGVGNVCSEMAQAVVERWLPEGAREVYGATAQEAGEVSRKKRIKDRWTNMQSERREPSDVRHVYHKPSRKPDTRSHMVLMGDHQGETSKRQAMKREHEHGGRFIRSSPAKEGQPERAYFRSVGSVLHVGDHWQALDGAGEVVGSFAERWQAWRMADRFGIERAGDL